MGVNFKLFQSFNFKHLDLNNLNKVYKNFSNLHFSSFGFLEAGGN
jgi:hypothetical protein